MTLLQKVHLGGILDLKVSLPGLGSFAWLMALENQKHTKHNHVFGVSKKIISPTTVLQVHTPTGLLVNLTMVDMGKIVCS